MAEYKSLKAAFKAVEKSTTKLLAKKKSEIASAVNKEITATRKMIVESMMTKTGLKRKALNDRLSITRANPKNEIIEAKITPLYGKRIYMKEYPHAVVTARGGKKTIRLTSPIYRKNMRTGFMSADGSRMYLRVQGDQRSTVRAVKGRSVPRLFNEFQIIEKFQAKAIERVRAILRRIL